PEVRLRAAEEGRKRSGAGAEHAKLRMWPDSPRVAAVYAAQPQEETPELEIDGQVRGLLSATLCEILSRPSTRPLTYVDLVRLVHARYAALGRSFPTPTAEGQLVGRAVLSFDEVMPRRPAVVL